MKTTLDISYYLRQTLMELFACLLIVLAIILELTSGCYSSLRYVDGYWEDGFIYWKYNHSLPYDFKQKYPKAAVIDDKYSDWLDSMVPLMCDFVYEEYGIKVDKVPFSIYTSDESDGVFTVIDKGGDCIIYLSSLFADKFEEYIYATLIHEAFHMLSVDKGYFSSVSKDILKDSLLSEGFTDILTDKFIETYQLGVPKRYKISGYKYEISLLNCILAYGSEQDFAKFYFLKDEKFMQDFSDRVRSVAHTTSLFDASEKLEYRLYYMRFSSLSMEKYAYYFYSSLEIAAYYLKSFEGVDKEDVSKYFEEVVPTIRSSLKRIYGNIPDDFDQNVEYVTNIL